jgi:hypothetical protein
MHLLDCSLTCTRTALTLHRAYLRRRLYTLTPAIITALIHHSTTT